MGIENQKEFALTIIPKCRFNFESGVLFKARKEKKDILTLLKAFGNEKVALGMNLRGMFVKKFNVKIEEDEKSA